tara:strand:+ start:9473 stop:11059 length:1587 start_codon:yes stop_codon:yes gene_type:complete
MSDFLEQLVNMYQGINKLAEPHVKRQKELKTDLQNERIFLNNQINQADTLDEINNLSSLLGKFENKARLSGNDEYSLELEYGDKKQNYNLADNAFNEAMQYQDLFESNPDEYAKDIIGMNWMDVQSEISNMQRIKEQMDNGTLSGYKYKGTQKTNENGEVVRNYSQASLTKAIDQRIINLNKQVSILDDNPEIWEIIQEDGTMDEESKALFDKFKFDLISGTKGEFDTDYQGLITNSSKKYQHNENMWIKYNEIGQKLIGGPQPLSDLLPKDLDPNSPNAAVYQTILGQAEAEGKSQLDWEWVEEQKQRYKDRADKFNRQHQILTGEQYQDDSPWAAPKNIPGMGVTGPQNQGASSPTQSNQLQQSSLPKNIDGDQDGVPNYLDPDTKPYEPPKEKFELDSPDLDKHNSKIDFDTAIQDLQTGIASKNTAKNYSWHNESIGSYVDDILMNSNDAMLFIDFGQQLANSNIDLRKKGAYKDLGSQVDKVAEKFKSIIDNMSPSRQKEAYIRSFNKQFGKFSKHRIKSSYK